MSSDTSRSTPSSASSNASSSTSAPAQSPYGGASLLPTRSLVGRPRRHGLRSVAHWHGVGALVAAGITAVITALIAASPGGLNNPDDFIPAWIFPVLFAFAAGAALVASFVIAALVMGFVAPRVKVLDLAAHGLAVSVASFFVGVPALWLGLRAVRVVAGA